MLAVAVAVLLIAPLERATVTAQSPAPATIAREGDALVYRGGPGSLGLLLTYGFDPTKTEGPFFVVRGHLPEGQFADVAPGPGCRRSPERDVRCTANGVTRVEALGEEGHDELLAVPDEPWPSSLTAINLRGGPGNDRLHAVGGNVRATLEGGDGLDLFLIAGAATPQIVDGGPGDDVVAARGGAADTITAGEGLDLIDVERGGADTVSCGPGVDSTLHDPGDQLAADCEPATRRVIAEPVSRVVLVRAPGARRFRRLRTTKVLRAGSTVDVSRGRVRLLNPGARGGDIFGSVSRGIFYGGVFRLGPTKKSGLSSFWAPGSVAPLRLKGVLRCSRGRNTGRLRLRAAADTGFETRGRYAGAVADEGNTRRWLAEDRCAGTLIRVARGPVLVIDRSRHGVRRVGSGGSHRARPR